MGSEALISGAALVFIIILCIMLSKWRRTRDDTISHDLAIVGVATNVTSKMNDGLPTYDEAVQAQQAHDLKAGNSNAAPTSTMVHN